MKWEDSASNEYRDMSDEAVMRRYDKAALKAVVSYDSVLMSSLADITKLLKEREVLQKEIERLRNT